jgi:DNA-binding NarL/FixJ family response regulator
VLLDISMPQKNGIDCLRVIRQTKPALPVLVLSGYPEADYAINMLRLRRQRLYLEERASGRGHPGHSRRRPRQALPERDCGGLVSAELDRGAHEKPHELLSEREFQIFHKLAAGQSPTEIAGELHLSVKTVSTYRARGAGEDEAED